jgi:hypothetical protein
VKELNNKYSKDITRAEAIKRIGKHGKYAAITAISTYLILDPKVSQAASPLPSDLGTGF